MGMGRGVIYRKQCEKRSLRRRMRSGEVPRRRQKGVRNALTLLLIEKIILIRIDDYNLVVRRVIRSRKVGVPA